MLWGGFVWDDGTYIVEAEFVRDLSGLWQIWFSPAEHVENHYWPLVYTTFWLEHKLWGFNPTGYHIVNGTATLGEYTTGVAPHAAVSGVWRMDDGCGVCRASFARGVGCLDH